MPLSKVQMVTLLISFLLVCLEGQRATVSSRHSVLATVVARLSSGRRAAITKKNLPMMSPLLGSKIQSCFFSSSRTVERNLLSKLTSMKQIVFCRCLLSILVCQFPTPIFFVSVCSQSDSPQAKTSLFSAHRSFLMKISLGECDGGG